MSYLLQYVRRPNALARRVDEYARLNHPGLYGDAYVRVSVTRGHRGHEPQFVLEIADCTNTINLEFSVASALLRENSLFKIDTLIGALECFRRGLAAEVELAERAG
jgi:hypothetical protein